MFANWFNLQPQRPLYFQPQQQQYPQPKPQPKPQPNPQPKPEYFYYTIVDKNGDQTYTSSLLRLLNLYYDVRKFEDVGKTAIFNTGAVGNKIGRDAGKVMYAVRVDKANSDIIMNYIESVSPLPDGWEHLREPSGQVYYRNLTLGKTQYERPPPLGWTFVTGKDITPYYENPALKIVQYEFPKWCVLQPGWEVLRDPSGRVYYGNPALKKTQWERPCATAPSVSANLPAPASPVPSASPAPSVKYYVKVGDGDFPYESASKPLEDAINSVCPTDNSTCHTEMVRAYPPEQKEIDEYNAKIKNNLNGGAKNKKKHRRSKRRKSQSHKRKSHRRRMI
jgi:hypothetical protein